MADPFIGEVRMFAGNFAPRNWAFCNGQTILIAQNPAYFSIAGTIYGGDGRTTTGIPNLHNRAPMHAGHGPGLTNRPLGSHGGTVTETLTEGQMASHSHALVASLAAETTSPSNVVSFGAAPLYGSGGTNVAMADVMGSAGNNEPHNNRQPLLGMNFIVALQGTFPSRN